MAMDNVNITWNCGWTPPKLPEKTGELFDIEKIQPLIPDSLMADLIRTYCSHDLKGENNMTHNTNYERAISALMDPRGVSDVRLKVTPSRYSAAIELPVQLDYLTHKDGELELQCTARRDPMKRAVNSIYGMGSFRYASLPGIDKVLFNDPATIVFWKDGSKTVVKTQNETFDPEKGLAMAIAKKALGNEGNYFNVIKPHVEEYRKRFGIEMNAEALTLLKDNKPVYRVDGDGMGPVKEEEKKEETEGWYIWWINYDRNGQVMGKGRSTKCYKRKCDAARVGKRHYGNLGFHYEVAPTCPWNN